MALKRWLIVIMSSAITIIVLAGVTLRAQEVFSIIELDENTDPRFSMQHKNGEIGLIKPAGKRVFVNSQNIRERMALRSNDHVLTKSKSAARIEFVNGQSACQIAVSDFMEGNLHGDNGSCAHEVRTTHATTQTGASDTKYHISVSGKKTEITVLSGTITAALATDTTSVVTINAGQDAVITHKGITGPDSVSNKKIQKRTKWRQRYDFETGKAKGKTLFRDIAIGVGTAIILKEVYDKDKKDRKNDRKKDDKNKYDPPDAKNPDTDRYDPPDTNSDAGNNKRNQPTLNAPQTYEPTSPKTDPNKEDIELF